MTISMSQSNSAVGPGITSSFLAVGGTAPYTYTVLAGGAGGSIVARTGVYTAPLVLGTSPKTSYDTIRVTDNVGATVTSTILVGNALLLFCDILQKEMGLANGRVYLWDQKIIQPTDSELYIAVAELSPKVFGSNNEFSPSLNAQVQTVNISSTLTIDAISRGPAARDRKAEIIMALDSQYAESQMTTNSFYISRVSSAFQNLSNIDGAAIPYRYQISCQLQYAEIKTTTVSYYSTFSGYTVTTSN